MQPERVLLITERYPPHVGGLARASRRLASHAAASGVQTHVLVTRGEGAPGELHGQRDGEVRVHRLAPYRSAAETGQQASLVIDWLHERERFDLLHGQYGSTGGFLAAYHGSRLGIASYVSLRGNDVDRDAHDPTRFPFLEWALLRAGAVGAVSRALVHAAGRLAGRADVRYTPNSVDGELFRPAPPDATLREELGLGEGPVIGFAGELRHKKGAAFLLEAFARSAPPEARLLIAGALRPDARELLEEMLAEAPELAARVRACPYIHEPSRLAALYNLMDLAVFPSLWEGMPNAVLEAMACGRPVLASDAGGLPDLIAHGETGWLLSRHSLHRLGEALREALALPAAERAAIGARARERVLREFPLERERRELGEAYAAAAAGPGGAAGRP